MIMLKKIKSIQKYLPNPFISSLAALGMGLAGQFLLTAGRPVTGLILFILAALCFIWGVRHELSPQIQLSSFQPLSEGYRTHWGVICGGIAIGLAALAFSLFIAPVSKIIPWLLFLASMVLFILANFGLDRNQNSNETQNPWSKWDIRFLLAIIAIAAFMRLYLFDQFPYGTWYDEAVFGLEANKILSQPGYFPDFFQTMPAHFLFLIALAFRILGSSILSMRAVTVLFGLGNVLAGYLTGRELFNRKTGLILAFLLAVSRWDVNWSRIGMHAITVPFFELLTIGLLLRAFRRQRLMDYALAGLSIGLGASFYISFRLFPVVIVIFLLFLWLSRRDFWRSSWRGLLVFGLGAVIATTPVTQLFVSQPDALWSRMQDTSIFAGKTAQDGWQAVAQTTREHFLMFNYIGDHNGRQNLPGEPMLDLVSGALLVLGAALCLRRVRQPASFLMIIWLILMLIPGIFSLDFESPQSHRAIGSLPAAYLMVSVSINALWQIWKKYLSKFGMEVALAPLFLTLVAIGYLNFHTYFDLQTKSFESWNSFSTPETITAKIMNELGNQANYYVSVFYADTPTVQFLAPGITDYQKLQSNESLPLGLDGNKDAVFILDADRKPAYDEAKRDYPQAAFKDFKAPDGQTVLYEIHLQPADITAAQGITASYYPNGDWQAKPALVRKENQLNVDWRNNDPLPVPFGVEWKSVLYAPVYGNYHLVIHSPSAVELYLDEIKVDLIGDAQQTGEILLAKGTHNLRLRTVGKEGHFEMDWQPPSQALSPIPPSVFLSSPISNQGLLARYYSNNAWQGAPVLERIDAWIHFYYQEIPFPRPYTVEWLGSINIPQDGHYHFGLESIDQSALYIDDQKIIDAQKPNQYQDSELDLKAGLHPIQIYFSDLTGSSHINLFWTLPGGEREVIPSEALYPPSSKLDLLDPIPGLDLLTSPPNGQPQAQPQTPQPAPQLNPSAANILPASLAALPEIVSSTIWQIGSCGPGDQQFNAPHGISLDQSGNLWVADYGNHRMVEMDSSGKFIRAFGQEGEGDGQFKGPFDLVVEPDGSLVILDSESPKPLKHFSPQGDFISAFGDGRGLYNPRGLGMDAAGGLYLADTGTSRVVNLSLSGELLRQWKIEVPNTSSSQPVGITTGADGSIYTADAVGGMLWKIVAGGKMTGWQAASSSDTVNGPHVALGPANNLYISDPEQKRVVIFSTNGQPVGQIHPSQPFGKPLGVAVGKEGILFVSDADHCQVLALKLPGALLK